MEKLSSEVAKKRVDEAARISYKLKDKLDEVDNYLFRSEINGVGVYSSLVNLKTNLLIAKQKIDEVYKQIELSEREWPTQADYSEI